MSYKSYTTSDGKETFYRLGYNSAITTSTDPEDVWTKGGLYTFPLTTTPVNYIVSSGAADAGSNNPLNVDNTTLNSDGARAVHIKGLDINYDEIEETVFLKGTTGVHLINSYHRINECKVVITGTGLINEGNISLQYWNGSTAAGTYAYIAAGQNSIQSSIYTVPSGKFLYLEKIEVSPTDLAQAAATNIVNFSVNSGSGGVLYAIYRNSGGGTDPEGMYSNIRAKSYTFVRPILIPATTDIKITAVTVGATMAVRSVMEGYLLSGSYK